MLDGGLCLLPELDQPGGEAFVNLMTNTHGQDSVNKCGAPPSRVYMAHAALHRPSLRIQAALHEIPQGLLSS
jgi:hypothetical protein